MVRKTLTLSLILIGLAGGLALLSADEPKAPAPTDNEARLLQRIEQLERRVAELEKKLSEQQQRQRVFTVPPQPTPRQIDPSAWLRNLHRHEINGQTFYHVPVRR